ncbi:MAG TPA: preprotein translocase subunit SecE [Anaerolineales bacterium]
MAKADKGKSIERRSSNKIQLFFRETVGELRKVSWPTWQDAWNLTKIVLVVMVVMGLYLGVLDYIFTTLMALILG